MCRSELFGFEIVLFSHGSGLFHNDFFHNGLFCHVFGDDFFLSGGLFLSQLINRSFLSFAAGALSQQLLGKGNDLVAIGSNYEHSTGNGGQSSQDLQQSFQNLNLQRFDTISL